MSNEGIEAILLSGVVAVVLFVAVILGTMLGAFAGWVLSLTFLGDWITSGFKVFGIDTEGKLIVVGAMFGFLSGFFKSTVNKGN